MAKLCTFNPNLEIIKPTNYLANYFYILMSCRSLGYLEYVIEFCKISLVFFIFFYIKVNNTLKDKDYKTWFIPQSATMDLSTVKEVRIFEFILKKIIVKNKIKN